MQLCQGDEEETQCCFFDEAVKNERVSARYTKVSLSDVGKHRSIQKNLQAPQKQSRLISKNNKKLKSQQKGKLSLSKLSGRKASNSRDHCAAKQPAPHLMPSPASAPKPAKVHNQQSNLQPTYNKINYLQDNRYEFNSIQHPRQQQCQQPDPHFQSGKPQSVRLNKYENHIMKSNHQNPNFPPHYNQPQHYAIEAWQNKIAIPQQQFKCQSYLLNNSNYYQDQLGKLKNAPKPYTSQQYGNFNKNQIHWIFHDQGKGFITAPIVEAGHSRREQQQKLANFQNPVSFSRQKNSQFSPGPNRQFAQSRYTEDRSCYLQKPNLKTVQSVYSEDMNHKKQVQQSIIVVDYFNPPEHFRRQMEENLERRHHEHHNAFKF